jgi:folate-dependent phosphoribosylglycinamide formyltransferase PurN
MKRDWITFFSQTGSEIANVASFYKTVPGCIIHNKQHFERVNPWIKQQMDKQTTRFVQLSPTPTVDDYFAILKDYKNPLITLHGYLRIIPKEICEKYEIYNLHPGLITKYPDLKGKDPQDRAFQKQYDTAGCVIHRVIPEVDSGEIMLEHEINIKYKDLDRVYTELHTLGSAMWIRFLEKYV